MTKLTHQAVKAPTAEDLVRAIRDGGILDLAFDLGWVSDDWKNDTYGTEFPDAINYIASLITLPEQEQAAEVTNA